MAVPNSHVGDDQTALPDAVPFDLPHLSRLSWELGSRVVQDSESTLIEEWNHRDTGWTLSVFSVTSNTVVIRTRTPVGRERFYGAILSEANAAIRTLETQPSWQRAE